MAPDRRNIPPPPPYDHIHLSDEVRYLHSLWHQASRSNPNPNLHAINSAPFKKKKKETEKTRSPLIPWPAASSADPVHDESIGKWPSWPDLTPKQNSSSSAAEATNAGAIRFQRNGLRASADFLSKKTSSDSDSSDEDEEESSFEFFLELFKKDGELRGYYKKYNYEEKGGGELWCLVCCAMGVKVWRKYGDCVGIVQHSNGISKTRRRAAHRGYGRAVCRLLGWDATRLPSIVLDPNHRDSDTEDDDHHDDADADATD